MSKLLYIHKPSLTATVAYNPHPDVEKVALVDMVAVAANIIHPSYHLGQPEAVLAVCIKRRLKNLACMTTFKTPKDLVLWFINAHPQLTREGN